MAMSSRTLEAVRRLDVWDLDVGRDRLDGALARRVACIAGDRPRAVLGTDVSIDMIFPVAYGLLFALLLLRLFGDGRRFYLLPIAGAATDTFENLSIALLASTYDGAPSS